MDTYPARHRRDDHTPPTAALAAALNVRAAAGSTHRRQATDANRMAATR